jgi:hypothetical protein
VKGIFPADSDGTDVNAIDRSHRRDVVATGDDFGLVKLFRFPCPDKGQQGKEYRGHSSFVQNVRFTSGDRHVVSVGGMDLCTMQWRHTRREPTTGDAAVEEVFFHPRPKGGRFAFTDEEEMKPAPWPTVDPAGARDAQQGGDEPSTESRRQDALETNKADPTSPAPLWTWSDKTWAPPAAPKTAEMTRRRQPPQMEKRMTVASAPDSASFKAGVQANLTIDKDYNTLLSDSSKLAEFKTEVVSEMARALRKPLFEIEIISLRSGSTIVDVFIEESDPGRAAALQAEVRFGTLSKQVGRYSVKAVEVLIVAATNILGPSALTSQLRATDRARMDATALHKRTLTDARVVKGLAPSNELNLKFVHGYRGHDSRANLFVGTKQELIFHAAAVGIVMQVPVITPSVSLTSTR